MTEIAISKRPLPILQKDLKQWVEERTKIYLSVQDMALSNFEMTRIAVANMGTINVKIRAIEREIKRREEKD